MTTRPLQPPKGMWVIPVDVQPSDSVKKEVSELVRNVITKLGEIKKLDITVGNFAGEWQGEKSVSELRSSLLSPQQQFDQLTKDAKSEAVILYFHGGAYAVASPDTHRPMTRRIARDCGGKVFSVRYRLAPQNPFPSALIDAVMAYKYLIDPPPGAMHSPIDPGKIVFAGDSAGVQSLRSKMLTTLGWPGCRFNDFLGLCGSGISFASWRDGNFSVARSHTLFPICKYQSRIRLSTKSVGRSSSHNTKSGMATPRTAISLLF